MKRAVLDSYERVLCVVAHPDDESLFAGATIAHLANAGSHVTIAAITDGNLRYENSTLPPHKRTSLVQGEFNDACKILGAQPLFVGFSESPQVTPEESRAYYSAARKTILSIWPNLVLTHGSSGEYGHFLHAMIHRIIKSICREKWELWTFRACPPSAGKARWVNADDSASFAVDVRPVLDIKRGAIESYRSMQVPFAKVYGAVSPVIALGFDEYWSKVEY